MKRLHDITDYQKPCEALHFCPYGALVEEFPLHETARQYAQDHDMWVKFSQGHWEKCSKDDPEAHEDLNNAVQLVEDPYSCEIFGHDCPVFYLAEGFSENDNGDTNEGEQHA